MTKRPARKAIPTFRSEVEERNFWETHDTSPFSRAQLRPAQSAVRRCPRVSHEQPATCSGTCVCTSHSCIAPCSD